MISRKGIKLIAGVSSLVMFFSSIVSFSVHSGLVLNTADGDSGFMLKDYIEKGDGSSSLRKGDEVSSLDPEATDCSEILTKFRADEIEVAKTSGDMNYQRSFATITKTDMPFYVATHDEKIDSVRAGIVKYQFYYEKELTKRVAEIFEEKSSQGKESIMLDVGANIGWFSLVAAAHGATKVYSFEPNLQNTVRFCESLSLNRWLRDDRSKDVVIPIAKGAGNREDQRELYAVDEYNPGSFTFQKAIAKKIINGNETAHKVIGKMEITTLDSFAERHGWFDSRPSIALFKLDVEHFELEVFEGAEKLLKSRLIEKIAFELKPRQSLHAKSKIIKSLFDAGYEFYMEGIWMGPNKGVQKEYDKWQDLLEDINKKKYGENVMFRLRD